MDKTSFLDRINVSKEPLRAFDIDTLQVNLGYRCNMFCKHCHVEAGPQRKEIMGKDCIASVLRALMNDDIRTLDITGGAPELHPEFRHLVQKARGAGKSIIVRSNLTVFYEKQMEDLPAFFQENNVVVIASLPYYLGDNVDRVRGSGTFEKSVAALSRLNDLGYGNGSDGLVLNLVYNPPGAFLPAAQQSLEGEYRDELGRRYGITFDSLYTITNMPIGRFRDFLIRTNNLDSYLERLKCSFNPSAVDAIMCRRTISIAWDGRLFDCDFNQVIGLGIRKGYPRHIDEFDLKMLKNREIAFGDHCYGCTAGQGST